MTKQSIELAARWRRATAWASLLLLLISTTGCAKHFVVIKGEETVVVPKATLDQLYSDNERLLQALEECQGK